MTDAELAEYRATCEQLAAVGCLKSRQMLWLMDGFVSESRRADLAVQACDQARERRDQLGDEKEQALASVDGVDLREGHQRDNATPDELRSKLLGAGLRITTLKAIALDLLEKWAAGLECVAYDNLTAGEERAERDQIAGLVARYKARIEAANSEAK